MARLKVGVLISGRGSNLQALIDAAAEPGYPAEIVTVISNRPEAYGLARAGRAGLPASVIDHRDFGSRTAFDAVLSETLEEAGVELICLAGFMRILSGGFVAQWRDRMINIHPSLLPLFPGLETHARALAAGVKLHGCTVHYVREEMDTGPIIGQAAVPVLSRDTPEELAERVLAAEHRLYPLCLRLVAEGRARIAGEVVEIDGGTAPLPMLLNPAG